MEIKDAYDYIDKLKIFLAKEGKIKEVSEEFQNCEDRAMAIKFVQKLLIKYECMLDHTFVLKKSEESAEKYRKRGNDKYNKKKFLGALQCYNKSLCFSPSGSENIGIVYANRSAVYYELKLFDKSLDNVKQALTFGYKKIDKLLEREKKCMERIVNNYDLKLLHEPLGYNFLKLSYPPNHKIPFIANCLKLNESNQFGRYVVTKQKLKPGDIIAVEEPFSKCLLKTEIYKYCANCLTDNAMSLFPCPNCTQAMFCSDKCYSDGVMKFHRFECKIACVLNKVCTKIMRIAVHTFFEALAIFNYEILDLINYLAEKEEPSTVFDFDFSVESMKKARMLTAIESLATNENQRSASDKFQRCGIVAIITHLFLNHSSLKNILNTPLAQDYFRNFIYKQTQIAAINYHGIFDGIMSKSESSIGPQYASGSFPFCSLINHSCAPNIVRVSLKCKNYLMVNRPINAGEQLFDNYGYHHCLETLETRQDSLRNQYMFKCTCEACTKRFPLYVDLPRVDSNFDNFLGDDVAALTDLNVETAKKRFKEYCEYLDKMDYKYPCHEISSLQECILRCTFIFKATPFLLKLLESD